MIICGYPCIGKSSMAKYSDKIIDLESSHFKVDGRDNTNWEIGYCKMAHELSCQGYIVFTSTHGIVRSMFSKLRIPFTLCYPDLSLKEEWINRAEDRAKKTALHKDAMALARIRDFYLGDIKDLMESEAENHLVIRELPYDLRDILPYF